MVHTKLVMTSKNDDSARLPHAQMKSTANQPNGTYNFRPSTYVPRTIWSERGIDVSELKTTGIPNRILVHQWDNFVSPRPHYQPEIVQDFYAALVPESFKETGTVLVRGCKVVITAELINEYFHTPDVPETSLIMGLSRQEFAKKDLGFFVSALQSGKWNKSRDNELDPEMALWTMFINHNLMPLSIQPILSIETARVLFCINKGFPINVGHMIHSGICNAVSSASSLLPFPSLITHFCRISGVTISGYMCPPLADMGREWCNAFAQQQGLPTLPSRKRGGEPLPVELPKGNTDRPKWVNDITGRLNSLSDMMVGQYNALSTQIHNLGMRVTSLEDAVRDAGFEHNQVRRVRIRLSE